VASAAGPQAVAVDVERRGAAEPVTSGAAAAEIRGATATTTPGGNSSETAHRRLREIAVEEGERTSVRSHAGARSLGEASSRSAIMPAMREPTVREMVAIRPETGRRAWAVWAVIAGILLVIAGVAMGYFWFAPGQGLQ
jgi:hypothetical protein